MKTDKIGKWSELKLEIIKKYAKAYTRILSNENWCKGYFYIDAFSGAGFHESRNTGELIQGSPINALEIDPAFSEYHFIDLDKGKIGNLKQLVGEAPNKYFYNEDCNQVLMKSIFPKLPYNSYKRALCLLDPYGLHLNWETVMKAAELKTMDVFINFSVMDMNMNVLFDKLEYVTPENINRMNAFWGDDSWKDIIYKVNMNLFGDEYNKKEENFTKLGKEYRNRLKKTAGFTFVPEPILMRNKSNGPLYYLYFASQQKLADDIINDIFKKYK
ncbi:three-Cys-motif partner protein TcmP [Candidatus Magnetomonas plexicatena]|uniref:three-Cys-motif partner protein TcmP n=1 Tax=Candidatus Magnetomonas plexicatena TaxID=2552947 RepID=UPI001C7965E5|nr:three-Cys-motif partner protein TcmP [Nitrospirales bacterium LBB_01]